MRIVEDIECIPFPTTEKNVYNNSQTSLEDLDEAVKKLAIF